MNKIVDNITIIICSRNREHYLINALGSISKLCIPPGIYVELVLVDNASTDNTSKIAQDFRCPFYFRYIREERLGHSIALNRGISESKGELLLFTDDDAIVDRNWLIEYWRSANCYKDGGYFFGKIKPLFDQAPPFWWELAPRSLKGRDQGERVIRYTKFCYDSYPIGVNMAVRKEVISIHEPFDKALGPSPITGLTGGADIELGKKIIMMGYPAYYLPSTIVHHHIKADRLKWNYLVKRAYLDGKASLRYRDIQLGNNIFGMPISYLVVLLRKILACTLNYISGREIIARQQFLEIMKIFGFCKAYKTISRK